MYLVGNKCDIEEERQVDYEAALQFAKDNDFKYFETSAKTGVNVDDLFQNIAEEIKGKSDYTLIKPSEKLTNEKYNDVLNIDTNTYADKYELGATKKKG